MTSDPQDAPAGGLTSGVGSMVFAEAAVKPQDTVKDGVRWPKAPYKGLNFYRASDAPLFGERESETEACAAIVGSPATRLLLIHGRTGTGKSSFLRAGLLPCLEAQGRHFTLLRRLDSPSEAYLVRCTDDPILRLSNALALALKEDPGFSALTVKTRDAALAALEERQPADRRKTAKGVYDALRLITANLVGTLVLAVDQSEEVLTLSTDVGDHDYRKAAFFQLLENLCFRRIDIRLIITLRTEYYGHFCDHFRIGPRLSITPAIGGLEQFMLHGLQDQQSLTAAIRRPTLRGDVRPFGVPFPEYQFEYEPGLIDRIATDILRHCGESSALPVMQLICNDLHKKVVIQGHRHIITADDYKREGEVEGAIEAFIESAIQDGIEKVAHRKATSGELTVWKDLMATLVVRQEGGALTTQLLPRRELEEMARGLRVKADPAEILNEFSAEEVRLLRRVATPDASGQSSSDKFSLGHDALAPVLLQWREAREKIEQQKRRNRKFLIANAGVMLFLFLICTFIFAQNLLLRGQSIEALGAYAVGESTQNSRVRLVLLLGGWSIADGWERKYLPFRETLLHYIDTRRRIETTIFEAPAVMRSAKAISINPEGTAIALLGQHYDVNVISLATSDGQLKIHETSVGEVPEEAGDQDTSSAVGFLNGVADPVVYRGGILYVLRDGTYKKISVIDLAPDLFSKTMPWPEIAGGVLRLKTRDRGQRNLRFANVMYTIETGQFEATPVQELAVRTGPWPTFSDFSSKYIRSTPDQANPTTAFLVVGSTENPANEQRIADMLIEGTNGDQHAQPDAPPVFLRSLAFSDGDEAVAVRDSQNTFRIITGLWTTPREASSKFTVAIPNVMQAAPVRSAWSLARPTLAVTKTPSTWRLAWLTTQGIMVLDADAASNHGLGIPRWPPLTPSARDVEAVTKLRFSGNGRFLITLEPKWQQSTRLRVYDLSDERRDFIRGLSDAGLRAEACRIAQQHEDSNQLTTAEMNAWPLIGASQPCKR